LLMKIWLALLPLALAACAQTSSSSSVRLLPVGPEPEQLEAGFDRAAIERDLFLSARSRFGEAAIRRAFAADSYIFAKYYPGMMPPPPAGMPRDWQPKFPFALLFEEKGQWLAATPTGVRAVNPAALSKVQAALSEARFWTQPSWTPPRCTDAGASILLIKVKGRKEALRRGSCGETELTQRLVLAAIEA
jgi:hypothetical protein